MIDPEIEDAEFDALLAGMATADSVPYDVRRTPGNDRIRVLIKLPHRRQYGHDSNTLEITYGCAFEVAVGDLVRCPPTPRHDQWSTGLVIGLHDGGHHGTVKYVQHIPSQK